MEFTSSQLAEKLGGELSGDKTIKLTGISDLTNASESQASFILSEKFAQSAAASKAPVIISDSASVNGKTMIKVKNAKASYAKAIVLFNPPAEFAGFISPRASVDPSAKIASSAFVDDFASVKSGAVIGEKVYIGPGAFIGEKCDIGDMTRINPNVAVYAGTKIGASCIIHSGTVIGSDGFGFVEDQGKIVKVPQIGNVVIGSFVEIGSNCSIDRAAFGSTKIGNAVKLDNMVHVAHNVEIGDGTMVAAQAGIAGSSKIGMYCIIGGQVGVADHVKIGSMNIIGSQSGVSKDVPDKSPLLSGTPAHPLMEIKRNEAYVRRLKELFERVKKLEEEKK